MDSHAGTHEVPARLRFRQALALPIYMIALILDFASSALDRLAAGIAGDDWPARP
jgi:hypothetical protein